MKKALILLALFSAMSAGCSRKTIPVQSAYTHHGSERITDTVTRIIPDSALIRALLECDSLGQVRIRELSSENGRLVQVNMQLKNNVLHLAAQGESRERVREVYKTDSVYREVPVVVYETETVTEYTLRWWQKWLAWIGVFYLGRCVVKIAANKGKVTLRSFLQLF